MSRQKEEETIQKARLSIAEVFIVEQYFWCLKSEPPFH
jgi:hypothetical protein